MSYIVSAIILLFLFFWARMTYAIIEPVIIQFINLFRKNKIKY